MFKARAKKEKNVRKRPVEEVNDEDNGSELSLEELRALKEDQKFRDRKKPQLGEQPRAAVAATSAGASSDRNASTATLDGQFTTQSKSTSGHVYEEIKNKYIEERLREKYAVPTVEVVSQARSEELELYRIPDHLRGPMNMPDEPAASGRSILSWNAGIAEVGLPAADAQDMVAAMKSALDNREAKGTTKPSKDLPTNMSSNFTQRGGGAAAAADKRALESFRQTRREEAT
ncbi:Aste57867_13507 [Aphanomyces stellatus]|uniref:Aste57867_13507 protein n=1 Tax=Aphanomyces stellatus TaxID=120398 RepID=A0A485KZ67_9STRA|nr:hypothetical protein As57867_013457 [Aphanomyces stellatus]VFT90345.1 Aste57867_13507 [Aphanomyces stellatus]